jgi:acyl CoA:acetate/3-ketoacid CoA transferase alpha subunit
MIEVGLREAVAELLQPGMTVFLDSTAMAAARALVEVFGRQSPRFTVVVPRAGMVAPVLIRGGVVAKIVAGGMLNPHLGRVPPPEVQEAYRSGEVEFELLTLQTIGLRLMAGAMNWPFIPSRSIAGSDLESSFPETVQRVKDPFGSSEVTVLKPLVADVAIGHAVAADREGRTAFPAASDHGGWGMLASLRGVIVMAEAVVHELPSVPSQNGVPASQVLGICASAGAAHPYAFPGCLPPLVEAYGADPKAIPAPDRSISETRSAADHALRPRRFDASADRDVSTVESVFLAGSEMIGRVLAHRLRVVLEGSGKAKAVTDYATSVLSSRGVLLDRVGGIAGLKDEGIGQNPITAYGYLLGGPERRSIGCISALQIDRLGNVNNTVLSDGPTMLVGSGGANDAAASCNELMILTSGHPSTVLHDVEFVTVPGSKVTAVVAGRCVFVRTPEGVLALARVLGSVTPAVDSLLERAEDSGWIIDEPEIVPAPEAAELRAIETILKRSM